MVPLISQPLILLERKPFMGLKMIIIYRYVLFYYKIKNDNSNLFKSFIQICNKYNLIFKPISNSQGSLYCSRDQMDCMYHFRKI